MDNNSLKEEFFNKFAGKTFTYVQIANFWLSKMDLQRKELLASQKEKMLGVLEGVDIQDYMYGSEYEIGFNKCKSDIKKKITDL